MKILIYTIFLAVILSSCDLLNPQKEDPNTLGGETNLELTKPGKVSYTYLDIGGSSLPSGSMTVVSNTDGIVVYKLSFNMKGYKDSAAIATLLPASYKDEKGNVSMDFKFKVTSEGIQDYFRREKPWTIVKYDDGVGTVYPFTTKNGSKQERKITEKTGQDDWPMGFLLIKTTKVEQELPESDPSVKKITYRANHKFGLVYVEMLLKNGQTVKLRIVP